MSEMAVALQAFAFQLARAANGGGLFPGPFFRGFLVKSAQFHLAVYAFALHLLFQGAQSLVDIIVPDDYVNDGSHSR